MKSESNFKPESGASHGAEPAKGADAPGELLRKLVTDCQSDLAEWIVPQSGISDHAVLNTLLGRLDGPQSRAALASPIKAEVTTGEAELAREIDKTLTHVRRNIPSGRARDLLTACRKRLISTPIPAGDKELAELMQQCEARCLCTPEYRKSDEGCSCIHCRCRAMIESLARERDALRLNHPAEGTVRCTCNSYPHTPNCGLDERLVILRHSLADALKRIDDICADAQAELKEEDAENASLRAKLADVRVKAIRQVRLVRRYYFSCNPPNTGLAQGFNFILNALDATEEERKSPL